MFDVLLLHITALACEWNSMHGCEYSSHLTKASPTILKLFKLAAIWIPAFDKLVLYWNQSTKLCCCWLEKCWIKLQKHRTWKLFLNFSILFFVVPVICFDGIFVVFVMFLFLSVILCFDIKSLDGHQAAHLKYQCWSYEQQQHFFKKLLLMKVQVWTRMIQYLKQVLIQLKNAYVWFRRIIALLNLWSLTISIYIM